MVLTHYEGSVTNIGSFVNGQYTFDGGTHLTAYKEAVARALMDFYKKDYSAEDCRQGINQIKNRNKTNRTAAVFNENLRDCRVHYGVKTTKELSQYIDQTSIFITEGKSASGTVTTARNSNYQAVFSIRGKSKSSYRSSDTKVLENTELRNLVAALGIGDGLGGLRYNKVIIATDADDDGMHIRMLLVTFFLKYYQDLIRAGHLFVLQTPLFRVRTKKQNRYCYNREERDSTVAELEKGKEMIEITRFKGLGEINDKEFAGFIGKDMRLDPITIDDAEDIQTLLSFYMGVNTAERQQFIISNLRSQEDIEGTE